MKSAGKEGARSFAHDATCSAFSPHKRNVRERGAGGSTPPNEKTGVARAAATLGSATRSNDACSTSKKRPRSTTRRPVVLLSRGLIERIANHRQFQYTKRFNPRRVLTTDSVPSTKCPHDNKSADLILTVGDILDPSEGALGWGAATRTYKVLDLLGKGTFGQVVQCKCSSGEKDVAIKIVKNKPAYLNQAKIELRILSILNTVERGKGDQTRIVTLLDHFTHFNHLCLVFEMLHSNLYEVLKRNSFRGLPSLLVSDFARQIADALVALRENGIIHCDLKPENIMLVDPSGMQAFTAKGGATSAKPRLKVIDFGSSCISESTPYTYIQSRFYRAPEVLVGCSYTSAIDLWSLGCIIAEMFLGLPIFPGVSEHNQLKRMQEILGEPPAQLIARGKRSSKFFNVVEEPAALNEPAHTGEEATFAMDIAASSEGGARKKVSFDGGSDAHKLPSSICSSRSSSISSMNESRCHHPAYSSSESTTFFSYSLKSPEQWAADKNLAKPEVTKRYIKKCKLKTLIMTGTKRSSGFVKSQRLDVVEVEDLNAWKVSLLDILSGLLQFDPDTRWTAWQVRKHPFLKHMPCLEAFQPPVDPRLAEDFSDSKDASSRSATIQIPGSSNASSSKGASPSSYRYGSSVDSTASISFSVSPPNRPMQPGPFGSSYMSRSPVHGNSGRFMYTGSPRAYPFASGKAKRKQSAHASALALKMQNARMGYSSAAVPIGVPSGKQKDEKRKQLPSHGYASLPDYSTGAYLGFSAGSTGVVRRRRAGSGDSRIKSNAPMIRTAVPEGECEDSDKATSELSPMSAGTAGSNASRSRSATSASTGDGGASVNKETLSPDLAAWDPFYNMLDEV